MEGSGEGVKLSAHQQRKQGQRGGGAAGAAWGLSLGVQALLQVESRQREVASTWGPLVQLLQHVAKASTTSMVGHGPSIAPGHSCLCECRRMGGLPLSKPQGSSTLPVRVQQGGRFSLIHALGQSTCTCASAAGWEGFLHPSLRAVHLYLCECSTPLGLPVVPLV